MAVSTLWNLLGSFAPLVVGVLAIPLLVREMGLVRFGVLTLVWVVIGYFGLFDLGVGRALTKIVVDKLGAGKTEDLSPMVWTSLTLMALLGALGTVILILLSPWLVHDALKIPEALRQETLLALYVMAFSLPLVTSTSGLRGVLVARQRFGTVNAIRIPMGTFSFVAPLLVLPFSKSLVPVVAVLTAGKLIGWVAHLWACLYALPALRKDFGLQRGVLGPVLRLGSWMTVSNIVSPVMTYLDRFSIGALLSMGAVAYYTTPFEVVTRLSIVPAAVTGVLFPAFALSFAQDRSRTTFLLSRGIKYVFLVSFPIVLMIVTLAPEGLRLWLGDEFARHSAVVMRWLAVGVLINSMAQVPFTLISGVGRPDITAKIHLVELPLYLIVLGWAIKGYGIEGAAIAWTVRITVDAILLNMIAFRMLPSFAVFLRRMCLSLTAGLLILYVATLPMGVATKMLFLATGLLAFVLIAWFWLLSPEEKSLVLNVKRRDLPVAEPAGTTEKETYFF